MAVCEICLEMKMPGKGPRVSYDSCPECGADVECRGYTVPTHDNQKQDYPVCDECGHAPILVCSECGWRNSVYEDVISGLKNLRSG